MPFMIVFGSVPEVSKVFFHKVSGFGREVFACVGHDSVFAGRLEVFQFADRLLDFFAGRGGFEFVVYVALVNKFMCEFVHGGVVTVE